MILQHTIGLGGGCHWCTEGVFASLKGIVQIKQGWIASIVPNTQFSEAIEVYFEPEIISLHDLLSIHLHTHACTANHTVRNKYRSAVYSYNGLQAQQSEKILQQLQGDFQQKVITQVLPFSEFKANKAELTNYLYSSPNRPFCQRYIHPKLQLLMQRFSKHVDKKKLTDAGINLLNNESINTKTPRTFEA
jgi:peptide-methionine (S)-S-oxide reductase